MASSNEQDRPNNLSYVSDTQPSRAYQFARTRRSRRYKALRLGIILGLLLGLYLFFPGRINVLLLGIDRTPVGSAVGRSDSLILTTAMPHRGYFGMLSIPRDLWVAIPGSGENRINAAHFFAEADQPGSGPYASLTWIFISASNSKVSDPSWMLWAVCR
jgi:hypothetical protein